MGSNDSGVEENANAAFADKHCEIRALVGTRNCLGHLIVASTRR